MHEIAIALDSFTIAFDPRSYDKVKVLLYLNNTYQECEKCFLGITLRGDLENAIALFCSGIGQISQSCHQKT